MAKRYVDNYDEGGMIALFLNKEDANAIYQKSASLDNGYEAVTPEEMHITVAYLDKEFLSKYGTDRILEATVKACERKPIRVKTGGVKVFDSTEKFPVYLEVLGDDVATLRQAILESLADNGIEYTDQYPQFVPHITLAYSEKPQCEMTVDQKEMEFDTLAIVDGKEIKELSFQNKSGRRINTGKVQAIMELDALLERVREELMGIIKWANYVEEEGEKATIPNAEFKSIADIINAARARAALGGRTISLRSLGITPNWSAKMGEVIIGNLIRGEGGKFASAENISDIVGLLGKANISPAMMQALIALYGGKQVAEKDVLKQLVDAGLASIVDGQTVMSGLGGDLVKAIKTAVPAKVDGVLNPKPATSGGGGRAAAKPKQTEAGEPIDEELRKRLIQTGRLTESEFNVLLSFGRGESVDNSVLEKLLTTGLVKKDPDGNFKFTVPGTRFYNALRDKNLRAALDAMSDGRELYYKELLEEGEDGEEVTEGDVDDMRITDTINTVGALHDTLSKPAMEALMKFVKDGKELGNSAGVLMSAGLVAKEGDSYKLTKDGKDFYDAIKAGNVLKALDILGYAWDSGVKTYADSNGETWLLTWTTNNFQDRDGEIFTLKSIQDYVARHENDDVKGEYRYWHEPGLKFGDIKAQVVSGGYLVELGTFDDTEVGQFFKNLLTEYPEGHPEFAPYGWGNSHGYVYQKEDREDAIYEWFEKKETSVLPLDAASNPYTLTEVLGDKSMKAFDSIKAIGERLGLPDLADRIINIGKKRTEILQEAGVASKAAIMKTEGGVEYPASDYAYVPDTEQPSAWKLRLSPPGEPGKRSREQLGAAAAAFSPGGFRGQKVQIPSEDVAKVKEKIRSEYKKLGVEDMDIPEGVKAFSGELRDLSAMVDDEEVKGQLVAAADELMKAEKFEVEMAAALEELANAVGGDLAEKLMDISARLHGSEQQTEEEVAEELAAEPAPEEEKQEEEPVDEEETMKSILSRVSTEFDFAGLEQVIGEQKELQENQKAAIAEATKEVKELIATIDELRKSFAERLAVMEAEIKQLKKSDEIKVAEKTLQVPRWNAYRAKEAAETVLDEKDKETFRKPSTPTVIEKITKTIMG